MKKKILILVLILTLAITSSAFAVDVKINEVDVQYNNDSGFPFIDKQGRTQVPLRATMESFGATVEWDQASLTATVEKDGISVKVPIGKSIIYIDGVEVANDTVAQIKENRTYLPVRVVLESFGYTVSWENNNVVATIAEESVLKSELAKKIIEETSNKIIHAISNKDSELISEFVHPVKGVRFTPYTYVSIENDIVFNQEEINNFFNDQAVYTWGSYDGKGDNILLTSNQYYDKFIYTADFINAEVIGYNEVLSRGNMTENQFEVYKNAIVVEYYFSGFNPDFAGIDWQSLRLVFEQYEGDWKLVGIIHNQWTI
jgi:copper amine oxidase-like protein